MYCFYCNNRSNKNTLLLVVSVSFMWEIVDGWMNRWIVDGGLVVKEVAHGSKHGTSFSVALGWRPTQCNPHCKNI